MTNDGIGHKTRWTITKFRDPTGDVAMKLRNGASESMLSDAMFGKEYIEGNVACNEGLAELILLICGSGSPTGWTAAAAYIGVGNGTATANATDTGLSGASKTYKAMDSTYPTYTGQTLKWRSTFASGDANYAWEEYTVINASSDTGKNLNHKVESKGTKASGETWTLELDITFS